MSRPETVGLFNFNMSYSLHLNLYSYLIDSVGK